MERSGAGVVFWCGGRGKRGGGGSSLPVGVPLDFQTELRGGGNRAASDPAQTKKIADLESRLNATIEERGLYEKANTHSGYLLDGLLFPGGGDGGGGRKKKKDPFAILSGSGGWHKNATSPPADAAAAASDEHPLILRSCVLELVVDYCTRVTNRVTNDYIAELNAIPESDPFPTLDEIEGRLLDDVAKREPYCGLIEMCLLTNFEGTGTDGMTAVEGGPSSSSSSSSCRPPKCPFANEAACAYVECCLDPNVQDEYGVVLGLIEEGERVSDKDWSGVGGGGKKGGDRTSSGGNDAASVGGWGIPVK